MLYLQNKTESQPLAIPRPGEVPTGNLVFTAKSTINLDMVINVSVLNLEVSDLYLFLAVSVPAGAPNGEYQFTLSAGDDVVTTGLLVLCQEGEGHTIVDGDEFSRTETENSATYEQYNPGE